MGSCHQSCLCPEHLAEMGSGRSQGAVPTFWGQKVYPRLQAVFKTGDCFSCREYLSSLRQVLIKWVGGFPNTDNQMIPGNGLPLRVPWVYSPLCQGRTAWESLGERWQLVLPSRWAYSSKSESFKVRGTCQQRVGASWFYIL